MRVEVGPECQTSDAVLRTLLLHTVGLTPTKISGRQIAVSEPTAYKLCSTNGPYSNCHGAHCQRSNPHGWTILRQAVTHEEASRACAEQFGMQLAAITTPEEQRVVNYLLQTDDEGLERAKFWTGGKAVNGQLGQWRGNWASNFPKRQFLQSPVYTSYSASGWEWRNDLSGHSKLPALCEARTIPNEKPNVKCLNNLCSAQAVCTPKGSAYSCRCLEGYFGNGFECSPTNCPVGTIKFKESCVKDPCTSCKPRFACEGYNLGSALAGCRCKAGWSGDNNLCLPQKSPSNPTQGPQIRTATSMSRTSMSARLQAEPVKKYSAGHAALTALTSKLNQLKSDRDLVIPKKPSVWQQKLAGPKIAPRTSTTQRPVTTFAPVRSTVSTYIPEIISHQLPTSNPIDIEALKREVAEFAQLAAEQSAQAVESKVKLSQDQMKDEVESVLALVQTFISQSEAERATLSSELERLQKYTSYFSNRIEEIDEEIDEVEGLKKLSQMEQQQFSSLTKIAENLRYKINNIQNSFQTKEEQTVKKITDVEGKVVETQLKVEKTEYENLQNERRIEQAEKRINDVEAVGLRALKTENRVLDAQDHLRQLDSLVDTIDANVEYQKEKFLSVQANSQDHEKAIEEVKFNITDLDHTIQNHNIEMKNFEKKVNYRTNTIYRKEQALTEKVAGIEKLTGNFTGQLESVSNDVEKNYVAFEVGLRHAATSAADARQKAQKTQTELAHFMRKQNRNSQALNGKINRQNDLLAFLMNQVQKLERQLAGESSEVTSRIYGK